MNAILEIKDLSLTRDNIEILKNLNLNLYPQHIHTLLGVNGSGKSSLAYAIMGLDGYSLSKGEILLQGKRINQLTISQRAQAGLTLAWQEPVRIEGLPIGKYISLGMRENSREKVYEALEAVALSPQAYAMRPIDDTLSGGERKRVELAAVYAMQPLVAILDEPDSGIDVLSINDIGNLIKKLAGEGTSILLITHREELVRQSDSASLMCLGTIIFSGNPDEAMSYYQSRCQSHQQTYGAQPWEFGTSSEIQKPGR